MSDTAQRLKAELGTLSVAERADLARFLLDTLGEAIDEESEDTLDEELDRRMAEIKSGQEPGIPAEQVFAELRRKYA